MMPRFSTTALDIFSQDHPILLLLLRLLSLGLDALRMMEKQDFKEPKLDPQVVTKFLPSMMSLMVDDLVRSLNSKLPKDDRETAITTIEHLGPPPDAYQVCVAVWCEVILLHN